MQSTTVSAHLGDTCVPTFHIENSKVAWVELGSVALPVTIFPTTPAQCLVIADAFRSLADAWLMEPEREHARERLLGGPGSRLYGDETPAEHRNDLHDDGLDDPAQQVASCLRCGGQGCDHGCGACDHAYDGPHSHKVCRECGGRGTAATRVAS